jgi:predicted phage terminase large subunit-like protein
MTNSGQAVLSQKTSEAEKDDLYALMRELETRRAREEFFYFSKVINGHHWFDKGDSRMDYHHEELCNTLQALWETRKQRVKTGHYTEWSRGTLKSTIVTEDFPMWLALNDHNIRILIDSQLAKNSMDFLQSIKGKFEDAYFKYLFGELYNPRFRWSTDELCLRRTAPLKEPTLMASGLDASKISKHYDVIIADDLIGDTNCDAPEQMAKAKRRFGGYGSLLNPNGMVCVVGTVWAPDDMGEHIEKLNKVATERLQTPPYYVTRYCDFKAGRRENGPEFPTLLPIEKLDAELRDQGERLYSCNYALVRRNDKTAWFMYDHLQYWPNEVVKNPMIDFPKHNIYITADPRKNGKGVDTDFATICVGLVTEKFDLYILELVRERLTDNQFFERIFDLNDKYKPMAVGFEAVFEQNTAYKTLQIKAQTEGKILPLRKLKRNTNKPKEQRIRSLCPIVETGKLFIREEFDGLKSEMFLYRGEGSVPHDDCLDVVASMVEIMDSAERVIPKDFYDNPNWLKDWEEKRKADPDMAAPPDPNTVQYLRAERDESRRNRKVLRRVSLRRAFA